MMIKKFALLFLSVCLCLSLAGCGGKDEYTSTSLTLNEDGTLIQIIKDTVEEGTDVKDLKAYVNDEAEAFNSAYEEPVLKVEKVSLDGNEAYIRIEYSNTAAYRDFNGVTCYSGTVGGAFAAGFTFECGFLSIGAEKLAGYALPAQDPALSVLIVNEPIAVKVPGTVTAFSSDITDGGDGWYVVASNPDSGLPEEFHGTNISESYIIYNPETEN